MLLLGRAVEKGVVCGDALAAVAVSGAAFAQANITGVLDVNVINNAKTTTQASSAVASQTTKSSQTSNLGGGWSTSELRFSGSEDLGGGLKASFQLNSDLRGDTPGFVTRDRFLQLAGDFGAVRVGRFVPAAAAGFHGFSGARTTGAAGNIYGLATNAPTTNALLHLGTSNFERQNTIQYSSPNFNGISVNLAYGDRSADRSDANRAGKNQQKQTSLHIAYAAGPLSVGVGMNKQTLNREDAPVGPASTTTLGAAVGGTGIATAPVARRELKADLNWIGVSYDLGVAKVMATHVNRKDKNNTAASVTTADLKVNSIGVAVPMGSVTLGANTFRGKDNRGTGNADDMKMSGYQLSATYALSKRTLIYAVTGESKSQRNSAANTTAQTVKVGTTGFGISHSF